MPDRLKDKDPTKGVSSSDFRLVHFPGWSIPSHLQAFPRVAELLLFHWTDPSPFGGFVRLRAPQSILRAVLASALLVLPVSAHAEMIDFTGLGRNAVVSVSGVRTGTFYAGELNWMWVGAPPAGFSQSFYTYCVDLLNLVVDPQTVAVRSTSQIAGVSANGGGKAAWLFNTYAPTIRGAGTNTQAAALQVAIWEALYDSSADLGTGNFRLNTTGAIRTQANVYLSGLYSPAGQYRTSTATWLDTVRGQDQMTSRVTEPPTLALFGVALMLFAGWLRRPLHRFGSRQ